MNNLLSHAKRELAIIGMKVDADDEMNAAMTKNIIELLEVFSEQGHSGFSANYCISMFSKLANFETIAPLTGQDSEWVHVGEYDDSIIYQNNRASNVFKEIDEKDGTTVAYQIDRYIFREPDGVTFTRGGDNGSRGYIESWPYEPEYTFVDVPFPAEEAAINSGGQ